MNARSITKIFLPLTVICAGVIVGELNASAKEAPTASRTTKTTKVAVAPQTGAALLGNVSIDANRPTPFSQFSIAQSSPSNPSQIDPGRSTPGNTPSTSPNNPADTTPSTGTQNNAAPLTNTTPSNSQSTPSQTNPSDITPGRSTPSTTPSGSQTNPADTTTPGTTAPGTTSPSDSTPVSPQNTPGTTTPDTTTPGTTTPDTTTPGTTTPGTTIPGTSQELAPGRATRSGSSYIGVGGNIGIGSGDTALGEGSFAVLSKIGLTRNFSVRPSVLFTDDVTVLIPITYDFSFGEGPTGGLGFTAAPYVGIGAAISTGDGADVGLLLTGGIDVPVTSQFTATASVNASVTGEAAVGILLGIGYNFAGF